MTTSPTSLVSFGPGPSTNGMGRVYCFWLLAEHLGWDFTHVALGTGDLWPPVAADRSFAERVVPARDLREAQRLIESRSDDRSAVVCVKNFPLHLKLLDRLRTTGPKLVDVDDPELQSAISSLRGRARLGIVNPVVIRRGRHPFQLRRALRRTARYPITVSNPSLQRTYAGSVVLPHVRLAPPPLAAPDGNVIRLGFIGTDRPHKGLGILREAAALLAVDREVSLTITAPRPVDAAPWETWLGPTTLEAGVDISSAVTVGVFPNAPGIWGDLQLPVKLIDAMLSARPVVITPLEPLQWAAGRDAVVVPHDDPAAIAREVRRLADDHETAGRLGSALRTRALGAFTPDAVAPTLATLLRTSSGR